MSIKRGVDFRRRETKLLFIQKYYFNNVKYYRDLEAWREFQSYFPKDFQIDDDICLEESFWSWSGMEVHLDRYEGNGERKYHIILVHGGGGNGRILSPIGVALSKMGYSCVAPDLPGFGLTKFKGPNAYEDWINLVFDLVEAESTLHKKPIVLCGISLGGMLSYQVACLSGKVDAIMVSSLADTTEQKVQMQLAKNDFLGRVSPWLLNKSKDLSDNIRIPIKITTKMWAMANDPSFVAKLKRDKVGSGSWVYLKFLRTMFEAKAKIAPEDFEQCPVLVFQPEKDYIIPWEITGNFYDRIKGRKEVVFLENCGHIPMEEPGIWQLKERAEEFLNSL